MHAVRVAIVDPYSSGAMLADSLVEHEVPCIAVESSPTLPQSMKSGFNPRLFREVIRHDGDLNRTLRTVSSHEPTHVIAGFESGVELADRLSEQMGLPANDARLRESRRNKYRMAEAARYHGLRTAQQFCSPNVEELLAWTQATRNWPVIVKPPQSVASDHVFCCHSIEEVKRAAEAIMSSINVLGLKNSSVLVQEFLPGTEYAVDTVSCNGQHKITAIWQYDRPVGPASFVCYDAMRLLPYEGERQAQLRSYDFDVLDAVGIRFGPAHCELIWVDGAPILVEVGARMSAGNNAVLSRLCGGICQLDETVRAILAPDRFLATLDSQPKLEKQAANVFLIPNHRGKLIQTRNVAELQSLPTLHSMSIATRAGEMLKHVAGLVTLISSDLDAIERDIRTIRELQRDGVFIVEKEPRQ